MTRAAFAAVALLLAPRAFAATGWRGRQTTTPVDPTPEEAAAAPAPAPPPPPAPPLAADPATTAARWGLTPGASPPTAPAPAAPPAVVADRWGVGTSATSPPPAAAPPPPPPPPEGPPPRNPYAATDYTAYTLDLGEVRLGLAEVGVGAAPRVQIATTPAWYALGAWNVKTKGDIVRAGPFDLALVGNVNGLLEGRDFQALWTRLGVVTSTRATDAWGIHVGAGWDHVLVRGLPSQQTLRAFIWDAESRAEYDAWYDTATDADANLEADQNLVSVRLATDYQFTHRDALVLQSSGIVWGQATSLLTASVDGERAELPPILNLDQLLVDETDPATALSATWQASLAYQATWRYLQIRLGFGWSAMDWAWVPATFDLSWRFGGKTRREAAAHWDHWRADQRVTREAHR